MIGTVSFSNLATAPGLFVDPACPVNWAHALNRGLTGWYKVIPNAGWRGGATFRDLCLKNHGTLTNFAAVPSAWGNRGGVFGGFGRLIFDGTNDYVNIVRGQARTGDYSVSCWVNLTGTQSDYAGIWAKTTNGTNSSYGMQFNGPGSNLVIYHDNVTQTGTGITRANLQNAGWRHITLTRSGTTQASYLDGAQVTSGTFATNPSSGDGALYFGAERTRAYFATGSMDDFRFYSRGLSAGEVKQLTLQGRQNYPDALNWVPLSGPFIPGAGGGPSTFNQAVNVNASGLASLSRSVGKVFLLSPATTPSILRQTGKVITKTASTTVTLTAIRAILLTLSVSASAVSTVAKSVGKPLAKTASTLALVLRTTSKTFTKNASTAVSLTAIRAILVTLAVSAATVASMRRQVGKIVAVSVAPLVTITKLVSKTLSVVASVLASLTTDGELPPEGAKGVRFFVERFRDNVFKDRPRRRKGKS